MPWWLAIIIAVPLVVGTVYLIKRWLSKRAEKKRQAAVKNNYRKIDRGDEFRNAPADSP